MAEEVKTNPEQETGGGEEVNPTIEDLMKQLEAERAEKERNKSALDKALKEKGDITKQLRQKQTTEEREAEEKKAEDERRQQEYDNAMSELNHLKATNAYTTVLSDDKVIENIIGAVADADHKSIALIIENEKKAAVKAAQAEWMKSRPPVNAGGAYSGMTREQIMGIADRDERLKAIAQNRDLF